MPTTKPAWINRTHPGIVLAVAFVSGALVTLALIAAGVLIGLQFR